jgi:ceroid-lipofuscinosis neuronal protein 5
MYFDSFDCASFVIRALDQLYHYGAQFYSNVHLNYTRINIYSYEPQFLGTYDQIIQNQTLHQDFINFYRDFDSSKPDSEEWIASLISIYESFYVDHRFYLYYNNVYWYLKLKESIPLEITFDEISIS